MVITRVTYYKCKAPPRTYHYVTLRDKVHLAHLWCEDHTKHICGLAQASRGRRPPTPELVTAASAGTNSEVLDCPLGRTSEKSLQDNRAEDQPRRIRHPSQIKRSWKDIFALFSGPAPILPL